MCGRFAQPRSSDDLAALFKARPATDLAGERFNVAPTDEVAAVFERHDERLVDTFRWGLVPVYEESRRNAARLINARAETVESTPAFRTAFARRRCIVPADAFYEWRRDSAAVGGRRVAPQPFAIRRVDGAPMAFAGLWSVWHDPATSERLFTCTIVTTVANVVVGSLHDRMPVVLEAGDWSAWLAETTPLPDLRALLMPAEPDLLETYPVSTAVNNVRSDGPQLLEPIASAMTSSAPPDAPMLGL